MIFRPRSQGRRRPPDEMQHASNGTDDMHGIHGLSGGTHGMHGPGNNWGLMGVCRSIFLGFSWFFMVFFMVVLGFSDISWLIIN